MTKKLRCVAITVLVSTVALFWCLTTARAQLRGVDVHVNEGGNVPAVDELQTVLNPGDMVRDVLGWHLVDPSCNLRNKPSALAISKAMSALYANVGAAGGKNFVTLAFNNTHCGQSSNSGHKTFPNTDMLRAEFAAYAVAVVEQVPALGGVSVWNEFNGNAGGGIKGNAQKLSQYCLLSNAVITEIRKINKDIPIAIGATVGRGIADWFTSMFDTYGCIGKNDPTIWLDVHPYLTGQFVNGNKENTWQLWNDDVAAIRADGITNPLFGSEWGGSAATRWVGIHPGGNYMTTFDAAVTAHDPAWAGLLWYELPAGNAVKSPGLFDRSGLNLTTFGSQYVAAYKH